MLCFEQAKFLSFFRPARNDGNGQVGVCVVVPGQKLTVIHPVEVIAGEYQQSIDPPIPQVGKHLANGVGCALEPVGVVLCLLGRQHFDKAGRETGKTVSPGNVTVERCRIVLGQHEYLHD